MIEGFRAVLAEALGNPNVSKVVDKGDGVTSPVRAEVLRAWAIAAGDSAAGLASWFLGRAPAGILREIDNFEVFPRKDEDDPRTLGAEDLSTDLEGFDPQLVSWGAPLGLSCPDSLQFA